MSYCFSSYLNCGEHEGRSKKSEARFKDLAECAADFFWEEDANGVVTFVSERVSDILGVPPEFFLGRAFDTWLHHETPGAGASEAKAAILKHLPYRQAEIQIDLPAEARWIRGSGNPGFSENGLFQGYRGACTDITAEKKTRDQIIHERNRAQGFLEMAGSMIVVIDRDGRIMEINRRCVEVLGRKKRDLLGRNWFDVAIPPEFRDEICDVHAKIIRGDLDRVAAYENEIVTRTGERRVIQWINSFIYDNDGTITATISSGEDVTEWLASRRALRDSEERFRGLFENSDISIWNEDFSQVCETLEELRRDGVTDLRRHLKQNQSLAWDLAAKVTVRDVNEATLKLFGAATRDELAYQIDNTFGQDIIDVFVEELCAIWNGERQFRSETTYRTLGGRDISAIVTFPIPEAREGLKSVPVSIIDTTERKRHIDALERSERALRESERRISAVLGNLPGVA